MADQTPRDWLRRFKAFHAADEDDIVNPHKIAPVADPTTPADRAALIEMTEEQVAEIRREVRAVSYQNEPSDVLRKIGSNVTTRGVYALLDELDAQRRALFQERQRRCGTCRCWVPSNRETDFRAQCSMGVSGATAEKASHHPYPITRRDFGCTLHELRADVRKAQGS